MLGYRWIKIYQAFADTARRVKIKIENVNLKVLQGKCSDFKFTFQSATVVINCTDLSPRNACRDTRPNCV